MEQQPIRKKRKVKVVPKKKSRKKLWIVLGSVLTVLLLAGGTAYYFLALKEYDIADTEVEEIVREPYVIELPDGTVLKVDEEGNVIEDEEVDGNVASADTSSGVSTNGSTDSPSDASESGDGSTGSTNNGSTGSTGAGSTNPSNNGSTGGSGSSGSSEESGSGTSGGSTGGSGETESITVASIKSKYEPTFAALEGQADTKLNALIGRAKAEYVAKSESEEGVSYAYFFNKYSSAARELEANTDGAFYALLGAIKNDLKKNGFSEGYADSFVSEYEARKAERRNSILSQVR